MRIIAGQLKGRTLKPPAWTGLRPTSDRLRETLFNVLAPRLPGSRFLDVFAGTGAVGIEALSRGARAVTFVEADRRAQALIDENLRRCGVSEGCAIIRAAAPQALERLVGSPGFEPFDLVFLDPPYDRPPADILTEIAALDGLVRPDGLVVMEHARRTATPERVGALLRQRLLPSGDSALAFYSCPL